MINMDYIKIAMVVELFYVLVNTFLQNFKTLKYLPLACVFGIFIVQYCYKSL